MGDRIDFRDGRWVVPDRPVIPFIEGDGTGPDIWRASRRVFDAVVEKVSRGKRRGEWLEVLAGEYAIQARRPSVTLVHRGNIMKFTEGAVREWGYEVAKERFGDKTVSEAETTKGKGAAGRVVIKDRIADSMFQQVLLRPEEYSVIATPNLNGDYLSDACVAQIGGLGMAPGGNVGDGFAVFEATHGTAPKYAGLDKVNPGAVLLSGAMMFEELGWSDSADAIIRGLSGAIAARRVTYDLARQMPGATEVSTSQFAECIIDHV